MIITLCENVFFLCLPALFSNYDIHVKLCYYVVHFNQSAKYSFVFSPHRYIDFSFIVDECPLGISVGSDRLTAADHIHG